MNLRLLLTSFLILISAPLFSSTMYAQHPVLFETFDNACEPCPATGIRAPFDEAVKSTVSSEGSKIIWLNYHIINICDPAAQSCPNATFVGNRLAEWTGPTNSGPIFYAAVDRTAFSSTGTRVDPNASGGSYSDWNSAIDQLHNSAPGASIMLDSATLDKTNQSSYTLRAYITITTLQSVPDSLILRCAITQNNVAFTGSGFCTSDPPPTPQNNVVRIITRKDTGMFVIVHGGTSSGVTKHVVYTQKITGPSGDPSWKTADMTLVAFLEESSTGSDYHVVNAAVLRQDLDTLQAPAPTLLLTSSALDGMTFHPGDIVPIPYSSSNLPNGVNAYYSLDNGSTWRLISDSNLGSPINWTVPDSLTTQGKIKLVAVGDANLSSIETGTFTIGVAASMSFVYPVNKVLHADSTYTIQWTKSGVAAVKLQYSLENNSGGFDKYTVVGDNITDTFATWTAPDTIDVVQFQLVADNNETPAVSAFDTIERLTKEGVTQNIPTNGLRVMDIFPNPAASGEEMIVRYSDNLLPISIQVLDMLGHLVGEFSGSHDQEIHLDTRALASGAYIVRISDGQSVISKRIEILR